MKNVKLAIDEKKKILTVTVDLKEEHGPSGSGKTIIIASTEGSQKIGFEDVVIGLNVYKKNPDAAKGK